MATAAMAQSPAMVRKTTRPMVHFRVCSRVLRSCCSLASSLELMVSMAVVSCCVDPTIWPTAERKSLSSPATLAESSRLCSLD